MKILVYCTDKNIFVTCDASYQWLTKRSDKSETIKIVENTSFPFAKYPFVIYSSRQKKGTFSVIKKCTSPKLNLKIRAQFFGHAVLQLYRMTQKSTPVWSSVKCTTKRNFQNLNSFVLPLS